MGTESYCYSTTSPGEAARKSNGNTGTKPLVFKRKLEPTTVYVITSAQNGTPVHPEFWRCLLQVKKHRSAELLVIPYRYKNPTSRWTASQANEEYWVEEVRPFLWNTRKTLNQNLVVVGDAKTQPTASSPLDGFQAITGSSSGIFGHPKLQMRCVATPCNRMAKILTTTGACTVGNYTDSKAGKLGNFHHTLSAIIVEISGKSFHIRQLNFDTKSESFTDLDTRYYGDRAVKAPRAKALVMGDTHADFLSEDVREATFGEVGIIETLRPEHLIWHDLLDGYAVNPHHRGNVFNSIAKIKANRNSIFDEVQRACHFVKDNTPKETLSVVVPSNHDDFLRRWIINTDWRQEPSNAEFYLSTALEMVRKTEFIPGYGTWYPSPFPMIFPQVVDTSNIKVLGQTMTEESFTLLGIELSMHGDRGPNGARGSIQNHKRLGVKSIIGHSHTLGIEEGAYQVGTSTGLRLEYNGGPSSWLNAHCVLNADGKRQIIIIVDGSWRS